MLSPADKWCERSKLLCQSQQNLKLVMIISTSLAHFIHRIYPLFSQNKYLILIVDGVGEEWDEL